MDRSESSANLNQTPLSSKSLYVESDTDPFEHVLRPFLPAASAVQVSSVVHVPAFVSNTQDSSLLACFVITNSHSSARQRGLR